MGLVKLEDMGFYAIFMNVKLNQEVLMKRDTSPIDMATTWSIASLGGAGAQGMPSYVRRAVGDLVDEFLNIFSC